MLSRHKNHAKYVVQLEISFNVDTITTWLKQGGVLETLEKKEPNWYAGNTHPLCNTYEIDVIPYAKGFDAYHHRRAGQISNNVGGIDWLENASSEMKEVCEKNDIEVFEWGMNQGLMAFSVNRKLCLLAPVDKLVELQVHGRLPKESMMSNSLSEAMRKNYEIEVPVTSDGSEVMQVWHGAASDRSVGYLNQLVSFSAQTLNHEVEY